MFRSGLNKVSCILIVVYIATDIFFGGLLSLYNTEILNLRFKSVLSKENKHSLLGASFLYFSLCMVIFTVIYHCTDGEYALFCCTINLWEL